MNSRRRRRALLLIALLVMLLLAIPVLMAISNPQDIINVLATYESNFGGTSLPAGTPFGTPMATPTP